jgi:hypothetical protein
VCQAFNPELCRALPSDGKVLVRLAGVTAEALLDLPSSHTKDATELPAVRVWTTQQ